MANKKRNKKYNPLRRDDYISRIEHLSSTLTPNSIKIKNILLENNFTVKDLISYGMMLYQQTYMYDQLTPDFNASNVRNWIEKEFNKLNDIKTKDELKPILSCKIKIHWKIRDLLVQFIEEIYTLTCGITSRNTYAKIINEAIICSNIRINLVATSMRKFVDIKDVMTSQESCRKRLKRNELIQAKQDGKIAYFDETGDIVITNKGEN
jgi:hypothetical protein